MGAWKNWEISMIESGATRQEIKAAEARIKGTMPPMPYEFHAYDGHSTLDERQAAWDDRMAKIALLQAAFPGSELIDEKEAA